MSARDLGSLGEATLEQWAHQVGINPNKVKNDKTGWDYILEFPFEEFSEPFNYESLDLFPQPLQCLIQVKSTDRCTSKCSSKLSNWLRLVKTSLPSFFLVYEFDGKDLPQRAYLIHIWEELIERVLKKLRMLGQKDLDSLNKRSMQLNYDETNSILPLNGIGLKKRILEYVGNPDEYERKKAHIKNNVGYTEPKLGFSTNIRIPDEYKDNVHELFVDFSLGLTSPLKVDRVIHHNIRFGIPTLDPKRGITEGGTIQVINQKSIGKTLLRIKTSDGKDEFSFKIDTYVPGGIKSLDRKYLKILFQAQFIKILFSPKKQELTFNFQLPPFREEHDLKELSLVSDLMLFLYRNSIPSNNHLFLEVYFNSKKIYEGEFNLKDYIAPEILYALEVIKCAANIYTQMILIDNVKVRIQDLIAQKTNLVFLNNILQLKPLELKILFSADENNLHSERVGVPEVVNCFIGQFHIYFALAVIGIPSLPKSTKDNQREYEIISNEVRIFEKNWMNTADGSSVRKSELIEKVARCLESEGYRVVVDTKKD